MPVTDPPDMYPCPIRMRAQSFPNFSRKAILKLQDQLSQHDRCKNLNQRHLRYVRQFKSNNQRIATVGSSKPQPCPAQGCLFGRDTLIGGFESTLCFKFCILEQIIATVLLICISSVNNKISLLRFQSTTAPTNRGWSACGWRSNVGSSAPVCTQSEAYLLKF